MGIAMRDGIRLAAREINEKAASSGGRCSWSSGTTRPPRARRPGGAGAHQPEKIVAGLGIVNTGVALASQRFYQQAHIPMITSVATGSIITKQFLPPQYPDNYIFRVSAPDTVQAAMIVEEAVVRQRLRKLAILHDSTNYGQLGREDLERALERHGIKPVAVERFNIRDVDMTRSSPAPAPPAPRHPHLRPRPRAGPPGQRHGAARLEGALVGSWALSMSNFIDKAGPNAEGTRMPQTFIQEGDTPRRKAFIDKYRKAFGVERIPVAPAAAQGYDSMLLLAAPSARPAAPTARLREALESLKEKVEGIVMVYDRPFSKTDHEAIDTPRIRSSGKYATVKWSSPTTKTESGTRSTNDPATRNPFPQRPGFSPSLPRPRPFFPSRRTKLRRPVPQARPAGALAQCPALPKPPHAHRAPGPATAPRRRKIREHVFAHADFVLYCEKSDRDPVHAGFSAPLPLPR
jgi:branched-chain amino acid transport system substrate-binding protein